MGDLLNKKNLSEQDICTKFITPAIINAGWDLFTQLKEQVRLTPGRIMAQSKPIKRDKAKVADYVLYYRPNIPIAVVEAKKNTETMRAGMGQAMEYAEMLDVPFAFSCNGDGFIEHDGTGLTSPMEKELAMDAFPSPSELWERYKTFKGISEEQEKIILKDYFMGDENKSPRYYQANAINRTMEAISKNQKRILLVMATGTGKTFVAFQNIWRFRRGGQNKRILFLADRDNLISQTMLNDFKPFKDIMTRIENRKADPSYEIFMALYQALTGVEEDKKIFKNFSRDFFDLIVVDECHRGSAAEDSQWREILEYFSGAIQIGLTATPKETKYVSNISYFGEPVYTYSLKQGIEDGFLAPYKVIRVMMDKDDGWRPAIGKTDKSGELVPDRIYNLSDYDRELVIDERTETVARRITEFLKHTNRFDKTIVFCQDVDHAQRMRSALVNENADEIMINRKYITQITGEEPERKFDLDNFKAASEKYPVIVTTSKLLNTGADVKTCKVVVIDKTIESMIEFKQIIGRGTRVEEDYNKLYFTIIDFRRATNLFADPDFDGEPVCVYEPGANDPITEPDDIHPIPDIIKEPSPVYGDEDIDIYGDEDTHAPKKKIYVNGVEIKIVNERILYTNEKGQLITESIRDYSKKIIRDEFSSLDDFLTRWNAADKKQAILSELEAHGLYFAALEEDVGKKFNIGGFDLFDLVCHVAFDKKPLTRRERADQVKKRNYFEKYGEKARQVLDALLEKYADRGIENIEDLEVLRIHPFDRFGTPVEIVRSFGSKDKYLEALKELVNELYNVAA